MQSWTLFWAYITSASSCRRIRHFLGVTSHQFRQALARENGAIDVGFDQLIWRACNCIRAADLLNVVHFKRIVSPTYQAWSLH